MIRAYDQILDQLSKARKTFEDELHEATCQERELSPLERAAVELYRVQEAGVDAIVDYLMSGNRAD